MKVKPSKKPTYRRVEGNQKFLQLNKWDESWAGKTLGKRLTLVMALNKVLIKGIPTKPKSKKNQESIVVENYEGVKETYYVHRRPHLEEFLEQMSKKFNLVIFTSSQPYYADAVIDLIDKYNLIHRRFYRDSCEKTNEGSIKKIELLEEGIHRAILLDAAEISAASHKNNLVLIKPWFGDDEKDTELLKAAKYLQTLDDHVSDVRDILERKPF